MYFLVLIILHVKKKKKRKRRKKRREGKNSGRGEKWEFASPRLDMSGAGSPWRSSDSYPPPLQASLSPDGCHVGVLRVKRDLS